MGTYKDEVRVETEKKLVRSVLLIKHVFVFFLAALNDMCKYTVCDYWLKIKIFL